MGSKTTTRAGRADGSAGRARLRLRVAAALALTCAAALAGASSAGAAAPQPTVSTSNAKEVSFGSATLAGSVNPNGKDTSYYFQYGPTRAYGGQTAIADAGAGSHPVGVKLPVTGLQPLTVYHFRLVAVNAAGASIGGDSRFLTTKVPLSLAILASPNPVLFGGTATVQGTLSGTGNANRVVVLQANPFPYAGFQTTGNPELTSATGGFSFPVLGLTTVTQFRVATTTNPPVISPIAIEAVTVRVDSHVARTGRRHFARIFGTVTPAEDGMQVAILRITHGHGVLVGGSILHHRNATSSKFSRVVPVRSGIYRVLVRVTNGAQASNYGTPLLIR
ncbi:MAG TPA: fibronectin type III domain-containing protein [Solirubrobacteraceae bacterium]|nr:fibronectin type III domain-containing protein [Solirubrobacteraceae bacterium]